MQNKGLIRLFAIILSVVCLYQLSFTWFAKNVENDAIIYAEANAESSESEVLGIGISVIALNLGMYLGIPVIAIIGLRRII